MSCLIHRVLKLGFMVSYNYVLTNHISFFSIHCSLMIWAGLLQIFIKFVIFRTKSLFTHHQALGRILIWNLKSNNNLKLSEFYAWLLLRPIQQLHQLFCDIQNRIFFFFSHHGWTTKEWLIFFILLKEKRGLLIQKCFISSQ